MRAGGNARRDLILSFPVSFKFGGVVIRQTKDRRGGAFDRTVQSFARSR